MKFPNAVFVFSDTCPQIIRIRSAAATVTSIWDYLNTVTLGYRTRSSDSTAISGRSVPATKQ